MTITYFPFDDGSGKAVYETQWTRMAKLWRSTGIITGELNQFEVYGDASSPLNVKCKSGTAWINGHYMSSDALTTVTLTNAHASYTRYDIICLEVNWNTNVCSIVAVAGTPAASPVDPTLTQTEGSIWQFPLARVEVNATVTTIAANKVTDLRTFSSGSTPPDTVYLQIIDAATAVTVADGYFYWTVPSTLNGKRLTDFDIAVYTVSSSGLPTVQLNNVTQSADVLSTKATIDVGEYNSYDAAAQPVINSTYETVHTGDRLRIDVDVAGTDTKGLDVIMVFEV